MKNKRRSGCEPPKFDAVRFTENSLLRPGSRNWKQPDEKFDEFAEKECVSFYKSETIGRPSIEPGVYFRMLMVGYFEGIDAERGIAWRCADSLSLKSFLGFGLTEDSPDHSTVSRTRRLMDLETHGRVFTWMLQVLAKHGLIDGKTIGVDGTTLEANAAMRSIVRRDTGESYTDYLTKLAKASGIETPTREDLARLDRNRAKKGSNEEWEHPDDPDAKITKMKDGQTHLGAQGGTCCGYGNRGCAGGDAAGCQRGRHDDDSANTDRTPSRSRSWPRLPRRRNR